MVRSTLARSHSRCLPAGPPEPRAVLRADRLRSRLNGYTETGSATAALSYGAVGVSENSAAVGVYAGYRWPVHGVWLEPGLRLEQRRIRLSGSDQGVAYADMPQLEYRLQQGPESDDRTTAALSLLMRFGFAVSSGLEYSYTGSDTFRSGASAPLCAPRSNRNAESARRPAAGRKSCRTKWRAMFVDRPVRGSTYRYRPTANRRYR